MDHAEPGMQIVREEVFGPVLVMLTYADVDAAVSLANETPYGLQGAVFTESLGTALHMARGLKLGGVMINRSSNTRLDHLPFGGVRDSGSGREGGRYSLEEMTERKLILIDSARAGSPHPLAR
jgi:acyl-CoA reductase-like NAD-dependent aldehyde dehydrogenase